MSAIDELKNPELVIDAAGGDDTQEDGVYIDSTTEDSSVNRVDLSSLNKRAGGHQIVRPGLSKSSTNRTSSANKKTVVATPARKVINISTVAEDEPEETHVSPMDDLLNPDNPNSMFSNYVKQKDDEAREWITAKEEEKAVLAEEAALEDEGIEIDATGSNVIGAETGYTTSNTNIKMTRDDDLDISSLFNDDKEENKMEDETKMANEKEILVTEEEIDIDAGIDTTDLPDANATEAEDEVVEESAKDTNIVEEIIDDEEDVDLSESDGEVIGKVEENKEPERYDAPDIDVEEQSGSFVTEIEEEDDTATTAVAATDDNEVLKHLQKLATEKLKPVSKQLDISSFTVLKKPVTNIAPIFKESSARVVKWVLPAQESIVLMKEFSGSELEKLREYSENARSVDSLNRRFHMIYDHIVSPKPATFEQWLKTTPYEDVDNYFFAIYVASFKGANFLPEDCVNKDCGETFLTDDVNIMDMVKFDTKEAKEKFAALYQSEATPAGKGVYCTEVVPMNNQIAIAFRQPSIYNVFEIASLDEKTRNAYSAIIDYIPYIDTIYAIDVENQTLTPITYKMFPDNAQRTVRSKIQKFDSIFSTMSVDDFGPVKAYVRAITEQSTGMHYVYPAVECPKCHTMTTEQRATAEELVFTRYQLGSLVTTRIN